MSSRFFQNNLSLKIVSVIIAIILWLYAVSELNPETTISVTDVPVIIENEDVLNKKQLSLVDKPVSNITIRIRGLVNDIRKVNTTNLKAVLDLGGIDWTGTRQVELNIEGLLPREVKLDKIPEISLTVDNIISRTVPVTIKKTGSAAEGYYEHPAVWEPQSITIYGAQSLVDSVAQGVVEVELNDDENTIDQSLPVKLVDAAQRTISSPYLKMRQGYAKVMIAIHPIKNLPVKAQVIGVPANGFIVDGVEVEPANLTVNGYASIIDNLSTLVTEAVDIQNATEDVYAAVEVKQEEGVFLEPGQSSQVNVVVRISETTVDRHLTFNTNQIELRNVPDGFLTEIADSSISVDVRGPYTAVNPLSASSLVSFVDLSQLDTGEGELVPGQYELPLSILAPEGVDIVRISSETVTVNISLNEEEAIHDENE